MSFSLYICLASGSVKGAFITYLERQITRGGGSGGGGGGGDEERDEEKQLEAFADWLEADSTDDELNGEGSPVH